MKHAATFCLCVRYWSGVQSRHRWPHGRPGEDQESRNMKALKRTAFIVALGLAAGGCSVIEYKTVAREDLKNAQGHVVGYKDVVRDRATGERSEERRVGKE